MSSGIGHGMIKYICIDCVQSKRYLLLVSEVFDEL